MKFDMNSINNDNKRQNDIHTNIWPGQMLRTHVIDLQILDEDIRKSNQIKWIMILIKVIIIIQCASEIAPFFPFVFLSLFEYHWIISYGVCFPVSLFVLDFQHSVKWKWIASERNKIKEKRIWKSTKGIESKQLTIAFRVSVCFELKGDGKRYI